MRIRHFFRLLAELTRYSRATGNWWILPLLVGLAILMLLVGLVEAAAPYAIYPIF